LLKILIWAGVLVRGSEPIITRRASLYIEDGVIVSIYNGFSNDRDVDMVIDLREGVVMPPLVNLHTHTADTSFMELASDLDIDSVVGEPYGAKYIMLRKMRDRIPSGIRLFLEMQREAGVGFVADFREGGLVGLEQGFEGSRGFEGIYIPMAMPTKIGEQGFGEEARELLLRARWIGISSPHYYSKEELGLLDKIAEELDGYIASHVAEVRETRDEGDFEAISNLKRLRLAVHGVFLGEGELGYLASRGVGLAVCPRSNMWFSRQPDLRAILRSGIKIGVGSDNGGWVKPDIWRDLELLLLLSRQQGVDLEPLRIIRIATIEAAEILGYKNYIDEGMPSRLIGLRSPWIDLSNIANIEYAIVKRGGPESVKLAMLNSRSIKIDRSIIYRGSSSS
jgi:cytosine/adenosine deaminase-related metal-dependent hydrolase